MAYEQSMTQTLTQAVTEAAKAAIMAFKEAEIPINNARLIQKVPGMGDPTLKQPSFNWKATDILHTM